MNPANICRECERNPEISKEMHDILWPTPNTSDRFHSHAGDIGRHYLRYEAKTEEDKEKLWPTPRQFMYKDAHSDRGKGNLGEGMNGQLNADWVSQLMDFPAWWTDIERSLEYATTFTDNSRKTLFILRKENGEETVRREIRGYENISEKEILFVDLLQQSSLKRKSNKISNREEVNKISQIMLRDVWNEKLFTDTSYRWKQKKQCNGKLNDIMRALSYEMALATRKDNTEKTLGLKNLWCSFSWIGYIPETLTALYELWKQISFTEKNIVIQIASCGSL